MITIRLLAGQDGHLKLADFGLSKIVTTSKRRSPLPELAQSPSHSSVIHSHGTHTAMTLMQKIMPLKVFHML